MSPRVAQDLQPLLFKLQRSQHHPAGRPTGYHIPGPAVVAQELQALAVAAEEAEAVALVHGTVEHVEEEGSEVFEVQEGEDVRQAAGVAEMQLLL